MPEPTGWSKITDVEFREDQQFAVLGLRGLVHVWVNTSDSADNIGPADHGPFKVFSFYDDELQFTDDDLLGLTVNEAKALHFERDVAYLRS